MQIRIRNTALPVPGHVLGNIVRAIPVPAPEVMVYWVSVHDNVFYDWSVA